MLRLLSCKEQRDTMGIAALSIAGAVLVIVIFSLLSWRCWRQHRNRIHSSDITHKSAQNKRKVSPPPPIVRHPRAQVSADTVHANNPSPISRISRGNSVHLQMDDAGRVNYSVEPEAVESIRRSGSASAEI